jgi:hypothetical protein
MSVGPVQLVLLGFETAERFNGDIARELLDLRGRGVIRVLDARLLHRSPEGDLTEVDLGELLVERPTELANPVARLLAGNGNGNGNGHPGQRALAETVGFALDDVHRLTDEIGPGDIALAILVEHRWAAHFREAVREAGGRLLGQGFLTPEVVMVIGAEIQAHADAEAAIELANATRGAALLEALETISKRQRATPEESAHAAAEVVRALTAGGLIDASDASAAIDALATAGLIEMAVVEAARAEAEDFLGDDDN